MADPGGRVLVVDDNILNRKQLTRLLGDQGYSVTAAEDGEQALALLADGSAPFDVILLDILMPGMDGYEVLSRVKGQPHLHHIPVIMISALDEMDSVIRCIELGATDYLPKPFKPALLQARLQTCLAEKRLRDLELEYLEQVGKVADAAQDVELGRFDPAALEPVAERADALGRLARVFQRMAKEVHLREQRLQRQLEQLRLDMNEMQRGRAEPASVWLPADRRHALARGETLPDRTSGSALLADISGFTPLTSELARDLGLRRGAEELTRGVDTVYNALIAELDRFGGSVITFAGDSITCWIDGDDGRRGAACALAMQTAMAHCSSITTPSGKVFPLSIKIAVVAGSTRRFLVGDPEQYVHEVVAGRTMYRLAAAERCAGRGEIIIGAEVAERLGASARISEWRAPGDDRFALLTDLTETVPPAPWPDLPADAVDDATCRPWLLPPVYERIRSGARRYLADLRPVAAVFVSFRGIDYDGDDEAGAKLDAYARWVQSLATTFDGALLQIITGDKGDYLLVGFGAPVSGHDDDARAVRCALALLAPPETLGFITSVRIGVASGLARAGAYGGETRRTYGAQGEKVSLAARLMQAAPVGGILCDEGIAQAASAQIRFEALPPARVKGRTEPVPAYRPLSQAEEGAAAGSGLDAPAAVSETLTPSEELVLRVASVLGSPFGLDLLTAVFPVDSEKKWLPERLRRLEQVGLVRRMWPDEIFSFSSQEIQESAYNAMLFSQRRTLHREVAEWHERTHAGRLAPHYMLLACHWEAGEEPTKALDYLEKAAQKAREDGDYTVAEQLLRRSVELESRGAVLSSQYYRDQAQPTAPDYDAAIRYALSRLENELSPDLTYHNLWHTRDDMLPAVRRLAEMSGLAKEERRLVEVAAAYHDLGFLADAREHERAASNIAAQVLPGFGFSSEQVAIAQGIILATRLPQSPRTLLEDVAADADLDNLGRPDFAERSAAMREESRRLGHTYTDEEWCARQLAFLVHHTYWTEAARELRNAGKRENVEALEAELTRLKAVRS